MLDTGCESKRIGLSGRRISEEQGNRVEIADLAFLVSYNRAEVISPQFSLSYNQSVIISC